MASQRMYPNESLVQFVSRFFSIPAAARRGLRFLEVGCGTGANLWMLCKEGFEVHGIDSSETGIAIARKHLREKWNVEADLKVGSFLELPYEESAFDAIVDVVSLQHLSLADSLIALEEIDRVLKTGGDFFSYRLSDHSDMYRYSGDGRVDYATVDNIPDRTQPLSNNGPVSFWSPTLATQMYEQCGLKVLSIERVGRTYRTGAYVEYLAIVGSKS